MKGRAASSYNSASRKETHALMKHDNRMTGTSAETVSKQNARQRRFKKVG